MHSYFCGRFSSSAKPIKAPKNFPRIERQKKKCINKNKNQISKL